MHHRGLLDRIGARLYRFIVVADRARPVTWRRPCPRGGSRSPRPLRCEPGPYPPDGSARVPHPAERACHVRAACTEPAPEDVTLHAGIPIVTVRPGLRSYRGRSGEQLHRSGDRAGQAPWAPGVIRTQCDPGVQTGWDGGPRTKIPCSWRKGGPLLLAGDTNSRASSKILVQDPTGVIAKRCREQPGSGCHPPGSPRTRGASDAKPSF